MTLDATPFPLDRLTGRGAPDAIALTAGRDVLTYAQLEGEVGRTAATLAARGLKPGDRVASWMAKTKLACILPLAAARAGLIHVPINPVLKRAQAAHILADSVASLLIANEARMKSLEPGDRADAKPVVLEEWKPANPRCNRHRATPRSLRRSFTRPAQRGGRRA